MSEQVVVLDEEKMYSRIVDFPNQLEKAWAGLWIKNLEQITLNKVVICGMGGSGIAGDLAVELFSQSKFPMVSWHDYQLPGWVDDQTLVIALSDSGQTEETLDAVKLAVEKKAHIVGISKEGKLAELAKINGFRHINIDYEGQPREAIGWLYGTLITLLVKYGLIDLSEHSYFQALAELKKTVEKNIFPEKAEEVAVILNNKVPLIMAHSPLSSVAKRWKNQINENSKSFALALETPEMCHNTIVGLDFPIPEKLTALFLESNFGFSRNIALKKVIEQYFTKKDIPFIPLSIRSGSALAEQFLFIHFGDLMSYYLAGVYGVDPTPIEAIKYIKEELKKN